MISDAMDNGYVCIDFSGKRVKRVYIPEKRLIPLANKLIKQYSYVNGKYKIIENYKAKK